MFRKYHSDTLKRCRSSIELTDNSQCYSLGKPTAGFSADTRFFGNNCELKFVVKRPRYHKYKTDAEILAIDAFLEESYRQEQAAWNAVYPNYRAYLSTEGGLRLILPCLPGRTLTNALSDDNLTRCQQLLSVAYAIQHFHQLGYTYTDFNTDNVLIDDIGNGCYQAYLIDFHNLDNIKQHVGAIQELTLTTRLIPGCDWRSRYDNCEQMIADLTEKLNRLTNNRSKLSTSLTDSFCHLPCAKM